MSTLHIVRQSAFISNDFAQCLQLAQAQDTIVFTDDGCYNLTSPLLETIEHPLQLMAINEHVKARAIQTFSRKAVIITMKDLVGLTLTANRVITWQ